MNKDRQFKIKDVEFTLQRIPPLSGWDITELFREAIARSGGLATELPEGDAKAHAKALIKILVGLKREDVKALRDELFQFVTFKVPDQPKQLNLAGVEDMAFEKIGPMAIYEVIGRAFYVNFTECFEEMLDRFGIKLAKPNPSDIAQ